ncbi:MAG: hypothetical protein Q4B28_08545 [bacterium]|nr:hypothetical protein [bacterium]
MNATWDTAFKNYHTTDQIKAYYDTLDLQQRMDFSTSTIVDTYLSHHKHL